jgi:opacity protein-like surface antigen
MKRALVAVAVLLLSFASAATAQDKQQAAKQPAVKPKTAQPPLEADVRKLWGAFKNKDKSALSSMLDDGFRQFEEGLSYTLSDFTVKSIGPNAAVVTYIARYEGKSGGVVSKGKSVFGEVWIRAGSEWKALYMQETYVK